MRTDLSPNLAKGSDITPIDTREELATIAGVSHGTIAKVERLERDAGLSDLYLTVCNST
jgi:hypothetical protein